MKKTFRLPVFLACASSFLIMTGCEDDPVQPPATSELRMNVGDWSRYEHFMLDENNAIIESTRFLKSRTVVQTGLSVFGNTNVVKTIDSVFLPSGALKSVDSSFFKISDKKLYVYNFGRMVAAIAPSEFGLVSVPTWIAVASLDSTASNLTMTDSLMMEFGSGGVQALRMQGKASGGASMSNTNQATFSTIKTDWNVTTNISGTTVDIPIEFYVGKGTSTASPLTVVGMKLSGFALADKEVQGQQYNLLEYKSGK